MRSLSLFGDRKFERYSYGPDFPAAMFWLNTLVFGVVYAGMLWLAADHLDSLRRASALLRSGAVLVLFPAIWTAYYRMHRRYQQIAREPSSLPRLARELQGLTIALVLCFCMVVGLSMSILRSILRLL